MLEVIFEHRQSGFYQSFQGTRLLRDDEAAVTRCPCPISSSSRGEVRAVFCLLGRARFWTPLQGCLHSHYIVFLNLLLLVKVQLVPIHQPRRNFESFRVREGSLLGGVLAYGKAMFQPHS